MTPAPVGGARVLFQKQLLKIMGTLRVRRASQRHRARGRMANRGGPKTPILSMDAGSEGLQAHARRRKSARPRAYRSRIVRLYDEPTPGAPRTVTDEQVDEVVCLTLEEAPAGSTHWSVRPRPARRGGGLRPWRRERSRPDTRMPARPLDRAGILVPLPIPIRGFAGVRGGIRF